MGHGHDGALVLGEVLLQPVHRLGVEVVGGLVEQQQVGLLQQQLAQRDAALLTAGEVGDGPVAGRAAQGVHGLLELGVEVPGVRVVQLLLQLAHLFEQRVGVVGRHLLGDLVEPVELALDLGDAVLHVLQDRLRLVQRRLLEQDADGVAGREERVTVRGLLQPRHDLQNGRLTGAVRADDADLRPREEVQGDVVEDHLVAVRFARLAHGVNELSQEKPSGNLKSGSGQIHPILPDRHPWGNPYRRTGLTCGCVAAGRGTAVTVGDEVPITSRRVHAHDRR